MSRTKKLNKKINQINNSSYREYGPADCHGHQGYTWNKYIHAGNMLTHIKYINLKTILEILVIFNIMTPPYISFSTTLGKKAGCGGI